MNAKKYFKDLKKLREFLDTEGNRMLFYHADADGVCSAALIARYFDRFQTQSRKGPRMDSKFVKYIIERRPDILVFLDMPVDVEHEELKRILRKLPKMKLVIIDHHIYERDMNSKNVVHVNPMMHEDIYIPVSYLTYKMLEFMKFPVKPDIWISTIGIIGDYGVECKDVLDETRKEFPELLGKDMFKSRLTEGAEIINAAATMYGYKGIDQVLESLLKARTYDDFGETSKFKKWNVHVNKEIKKLLRAFKLEEKKTNSDTVQVHKDIGLIFYLMNTDLSLSSSISTLLTKDYHDYVILIMRKVAEEGGYKISARCQSGRVDVAALMKKVTKGIGGGGGHAKAAGAFTSDLGIFKSRIIREMKSLL